MVLTTVAAFGQLDLSTAQIFSPYRPDSRFDLASQPEINDQIGSALASADFDNDPTRTFSSGTISLPRAGRWGPLS